MQYIYLTLFCIILILFVIRTIMIYKYFSDSKDKNKEVVEVKEDYSRKIELLLSKDNMVEQIDTLLDNLIKNAVNKYMILNVNFNRDAYLNDKAIEELSLYALGMVRDNMTPAIKETLGLIYDISTDEKLNSFLELRIKMYILAVVINTNKTLQQ